MSVSRTSYSTQQSGDKHRSVSPVVRGSIAPLSEEPTPSQQPPIDLERDWREKMADLCQIGRMALANPLLFNQQNMDDGIVGNNDNMNNNGYWDRISNDNNSGNSGNKSEKGGNNSNGNGNSNDNNGTNSGNNGNVFNNNNGATRSKPPAPPIVPNAVAPIIGPPVASPTPPPTAPSIAPPVPPMWPPALLQYWPINNEPDPSDHSGSDHSLHSGPMEYNSDDSSKNSWDRSKQYYANFLARIASSQPIKGDDSEYGDDNNNDNNGNNSNKNHLSGKNDDNGKNGEKEIDGPRVDIPPNEAFDRWWDQHEEELCRAHKSSRFRALLQDKRAQLYSNELDWERELALIDQIYFGYLSGYQSSSQPSIGGEIAIINGDNSNGKEESKNNSNSGSVNSDNNNNDSNGINHNNNYGNDYASTRSGGTSDSDHSDDNNRNNEGWSNGNYSNTFDNGSIFGGGIGASNGLNGGAPHHVDALGDIVFGKGGSGGLSNEINDYNGESEGDDRSVSCESDDGAIFLRAEERIDGSTSYIFTTSTAGPPGLSTSAKHPNGYGKANNHQSNSNTNNNNQQMNGNKNGNYGCDNSDWRAQMVVPRKFEILEKLGAIKGKRARKPLIKNEIERLRALKPHMTTQRPFNQWTKVLATRATRNLRLHEAKEKEEDLKYGLEVSMTPAARAILQIAAEDKLTNDFSDLSSIAESEGIQTIMPRHWQLLKLLRKDDTLTSRRVFINYIKRKFRKKKSYLNFRIKDDLLRKKVFYRSKFYKTAIRGASQPKHGKAGKKNKSKTR